MLRKKLHDCDTILRGSFENKRRKLVMNGFQGERWQIQEMVHQRDGTAESPDKVDSRVLQSLALKKYEDAILFPNIK